MIVNPGEFHPVFCFVWSGWRLFQLRDSFTKQCFRLVQLAPAAQQQAEALRVHSHRRVCLSPSFCVEVARFAIECFRLVQLLFLVEKVRQVDKRSGEAGVLRVQLPPH